MRGFVFDLLPLSLFPLPLPLLILWPYPSLPPPFPALSFLFGFSSNFSLLSLWLPLSIVCPFAASFFVVYPLIPRPSPPPTLPRLFLPEASVVAMDGEILWTFSNCLMSSSIYLTVPSSVPFPFPFPPFYFSFIFNIVLFLFSFFLSFVPFFAFSFSKFAFPFFDLLFLSFQFLWVPFGGISN